MGKIKRNLIRSLRLVEYAFLGAIVLHLGTQVNYCAHTIADMASPSKERKEFREEFGFPIRGWKSDIEEKPANLSKLGAIIQRERMEKPFDLVALRLRSENYFQRSFWEQMEHLILKVDKFDKFDIFDILDENIGCYMLDNIVLDSYFGDALIHHEIKHAKVEELIKEYPNFLQRWEDLARDEAGNSLYVGRAWKDTDLMENETLGFVGRYARKNVDEDIAETCELAEAYPHFYEKWLGDGKDKNLVITRKVQLAQEARLIPSEFSEYVMLRKTLEGAYESILTERTSTFVNNEEIKAEFGQDVFTELMSEQDKEFLKQSELFLEKYPETVYQSELRKVRGRIFKYDLPKAIIETKLVLASPYKEIYAYLDALEDLAFCYSLLGDTDKAAIYAEAKKEYHRRFDKGDINLTKRGVSDFLEERLRSLDK